MMIIDTPSRSRWREGVFQERDTAYVISPSFHLLQKRQEWKLIGGASVRSGRTRVDEEEYSWFFIITNIFSISRFAMNCIFCFYICDRRFFVDSARSLIISSPTCKLSVSNTICAIWMMYFCLRYWCLYNFNQHDVLVWYP